MNRKAERTEWADSVAGIVRRLSSAFPGRDALNAQVRLLALLESAAPFAERLDGLSSYVETCLGGVLCSVMLVDPSGRRLLLGAAPNLPATYLHAISSVPIDVHESSCGAAAALREMVIVDDIERSEFGTAWAAIAVAHDLRACWSVPIFDDARNLLGTLGVYHRVPHMPSVQEMDFVQFAASLASFTIQRHRDAEKLRANEARLSAALAGSRMGLWDCDPDGEGAWFDDWCEQVGIDPCNRPDREMCWRAQIHPEDLDRYVAAPEGCAGGGAETYVVEYRVRTRNGEWRWIHERGNVAVRDASGIPVHYVGVCFDIDDQKRTEAALRTAQDRYDLAVSAARLPVWEYDVETDRVSGNAHWHRLAGYELTEEEASQRTETWLSDVHPDDVPALERVFEGSAADETGFYEIEFRIKLPNGAYKWLLERGRVVERSDTGVPRKVVGVSLDIDARKQTENALRTSEQSLATALWGAQSAYWTVDLVANTTQLSESFFSMTGIDRSVWDAELEPWCTEVHPDDAPMGCARYRAHLEGRTEAFEHEYRLRTPGGWRWIQDRGRVVERDPSGRPLRICGTSIDISARKAVDREVLEAVNREQRRISYDLHEGLGQRLTGISLLLNVVGAQLRRQIPAATADLQAIENQVRDAIVETQALVRGLLSAGVESGDILSALQSLAQETAKAYKIKVDCVADGWHSQHVPAETAQHIYRIAQEALNNARRHGHATRVTLTLRVHHGALGLNIEDNGVGLPDRIRQVQGHGRQIMDYRAQIVGGTISVESPSSGGTQVTLHWPMVHDPNRSLAFLAKQGRCECALFNPDTTFKATGVKRTKDI